MIRTPHDVLARIRLSVARFAFGFGLDPQDAELLIMRARVAMGWVEAPEEPEELEPSEEHYAEAEAAGEAQDA